MSEQKFWDKVFLVLIADGETAKNAAQQADEALELRRQRTLNTGDHTELVTS